MGMLREHPWFKVRGGLYVGKLKQNSQCLRSRLMTRPASRPISRPQHHHRLSHPQGNASAFGHGYLAEASSNQELK